MPNRSLVLGAVFLVGWTCCVHALAPDLSVHFIAAGQGDAIFINWGEMEILIDGGPSSTWVNYLADYVDEAIELVIVTHPHADHIAGLPAVLERYRVNELWWSGATHTTTAYQRLVAAVTAAAIPTLTVQCGYEVRLGDGALKLEILHPCSLSGNFNNDSVVVRITYAQVSFLFMGDLEKEGEMHLLNRAVLGVVDVLKVGHHGSRTSSTGPFLSTIQPRVAVYCAGIGNPYGHPHGEVLHRLVAIGALVYGTDQGTVVVTTNGSQVWVGATQLPSR